MFCSFLNNRTIIELSGEDVIEFLQGIITNDARLLLESKPIYCAMLSPQGKFLHDFFLIPYNGKILVDISANRASDFLARIKLYKLRSKVEILESDSLIAAAIWNCELQNLPDTETLKIYTDPRLSQLGYRAVGTKNDIENFCSAKSGNFVTESEYNKFRLSLSVPDTADMIIDKSLIMECGFEELNGVHFAKGCYVGQEVTVRSKFRGQVRKSFYKITAKNNLPAIGTTITLGDKTIGELRSSEENTGIVIINNDEYELAKNSGAIILCDSAPVSISPPEWLKSQEG